MSSLQRHQVQFTGDAKTYFGIWIVNLLLTIVTLGVYSAWAKVRTRRYFSQHTVIDNRRFDYHATGLQLFIGRLIVTFFLALLFVPLLNIALMVSLIFIFPWLYNRSLAFNARMTSFSGLRFGFKGNYWGAFKVLVLYPIGVLLSLYTLVPFASRARHRYVIENYRFGTAAFSFESRISPFYKAYLAALAWGVAVLVLGLIVLGGYSGLLEVAQVFSDSGEGDDAAKLAAMMKIIPFYAIFFLAVFPAGFIYSAYMRNAVYAGTTLEGGHRFVSNVKPVDLLVIAITNAIVSLLSFGLALPWAHVRMARYMAKCTQVEANGTLDNFIAGEEERVTAIGDAYMDIEGIDVGIQL